jgi:urease accessory protein
MWKKLGTLAVMLTLSNVAMAHPGHALGNGIGAGLGHPLAGLDHLLAAVAVGLIASRSEAGRRLTLPLMFTLLVGAGFVGAASFTWIPFEGLIIVSLFAFSALLVLRHQPTMFWATGVVSAFALFHGVAHGVEAPAGAGLAYLAGLLASTFLLHLGGLVVGQRMNALVLRLCGLGLGSAGLLLAFS